MGKGKCMAMAILFKAAMFGCLLGLHITVEAIPSHLDVDATLKLLNKPAVETIKSEDGDIIDCVDIFKQPAFDQPS
ncbi:hypothetical protein K1719_021916 [Acacia pycnantha]|nr:hypothetical protein K1719_021916 [Acacia pycnantha]